MIYKKFTLIELLVVIFILLLLSGLLIPSIVSIRNKARRSTNISNFRQLGMAMSLYLDSNDGMYPYLTQNKNSNSLFLLLPFVGNNLEVFYSPLSWKTKKADSNFSKYINNPSSVIVDVTSGIDVEPGYAYSPVTNTYTPLYEGNVATDSPLVTNFNKHYDDEIYVLFGDGSVKKFRGSGYDT